MRTLVERVTNRASRSKEHAHPAATVEPRRVVGRCIYCGTTAEPLSREHIIPFGLNGTWTLGKASCDTCAAITSQFERDVLRNTLFAPRVALGFKTRRKKARPADLPIGINTGEGIKTIEIKAEEHPAIVVLPVFGSPSHLLGSETTPSLRLVNAVACQMGPGSVKEIWRKYGRKQLQIQVTYQPVNFARMLAKIAYSFCVAVFGYDVFEEIFVLPAILGQRDDVGKWVGSTDRPVTRSSALHDVRSDLVDGNLVVYIRLFANFNTCEYIVVVGRPKVADSTPIATEPESITEA